jgi:hypothetical protein
MVKPKAYKMIILPTKYNGWPPATLSHLGREWDRGFTSRIYKLAKELEANILKEGTHDTLIVKIENVPRIDWKPLKNYKNAYVIYKFKISARA